MLDKTWYLPDEVYVDDVSVTVTVGTQVTRYEIEQMAEFDGVYYYGKLVEDNNDAR